MATETAFCRQDKFVRVVSAPRQNCYETNKSFKTFPASLYDSDPTLLTIQNLKYQEFLIIKLLSVNADTQIYS